MAWREFLGAYGVSFARGLCGSLFFVLGGGLRGVAVRVLGAQALNAFGWCPDDVGMVLEWFSKGFRMGGKKTIRCLFLMTGLATGLANWTCKTEVCGIQEP